MKEYILNESDVEIIQEPTKNKYGQYFTPKIVAKFMVDLAEIDYASKILEPSCGEGVFLKILQEKGFENIDAYEIDTELSKEFKCVKYESFVTSSFSKKYDLIIGNPPYIRWKNLEKELKCELELNPLWNKYFNSLCDYLYIFILKSIENLEENGQLIFICPEYWMNTTNSLPLRNYMVENGFFEQIIHFNETPIFSNASVSVIIFKYIKSKKKQENISITKYYKNKAISSKILDDIKIKNLENEAIEYFTVPQFEKNKRWLLTNQNEIERISNFEKNCATQIEYQQDLFNQFISKSYPTIGDICEIGNGMVSGLDRAFQLNGENLNEFEKSKTINVIKAKDIEPFVYKGITKYIFANDILSDKELKEKFPNFYVKLISQKEKLNNRYQYNREINYWEWVFLRNFNLFNSNQPRIFVPCKERISNKDYFRFTFVPEDIYPTQDVTAIFPKKDTKESIYYILSFLNNHRIFLWLKNKGIVKGNIVEFSEKPISSIPFRRINWNDENEVKIHNEITNLAEQYINDKNEILLDEINVRLDKLLSL